MIKPEEFRKYAHEMVDWIANYFENIETYPVKANVHPREIYDALPDVPPEHPEPFSAIFQDFETQILKGITHWQHPGFFAYFNANTSYPSILGEMLTSALAAQCMIWDTSPAAAELEEKVMEWLKIMLGLPETWHGVIQDTASTATLCALLTAREKFSAFAINDHGFANSKPFRIYCSEEAHSSVEKAVKIAGFGRKNLIKIPVDEEYAMKVDALEHAILHDLEQDFQPLCVVGACGTTGSLALDPLKPIGAICQKYHLWFHVDAALAGNAAVLPEKRQIFDGVELADSYVSNPHKWMFTNFDCSAYFVKDKAALIKTFEILPEYLKTEHSSNTNNYRDWGIQLGRRFRALKLWFVIRSFGVEGIQEKFRLHIELAEYLASKLKTNRQIEILAPVHLNLVCFRIKPHHLVDEEKLTALNAAILERLNNSGKVYITHTKLNGKYTLRVSIGQTNVEKRHVDLLYELLMTEIEEFGNKYGS